VVVDPILALIAVAVLVNLGIMAMILLPQLFGRRSSNAETAAPAESLPGAVRMAAVGGRPEPDLLGGVPQRAYDRVVRIVAWVYLLSVTAIVALTGLWPETQSAIFILLALAGLFVVIVHDLLPADALGPAKFVLEGSVGITFAALLVLLTGQEVSPFFFTFLLIVAGAALVVPAGITVGLAVAASLAYLFAVLLPVDPAPIDPIAIATVGINLASLVLLTYVAMVVASEQRRSREAAIRLSTVDVLTGLFNRSFLFIAIEREIARTDRSGRGFCLLMMDLDGLKGVNDRFGHHVGDQLLRSVGEGIRTGVRRIDTPARYGGDEFVVLCPETDQNGAIVLAEKIRSSIADLAMEVPGELVRPSVSVGVVAYPTDGESPDALLISADRAMYASKRSGRNRVTVGHPEPGAPVVAPVGQPIRVAAEPIPTLVRDAPVPTSSGDQPEDVATERARDAV
jgi:diguanylate cyclase (GGDEF)-like protein